MNIVAIKPSKIQIGERLRQDLGDIDELAKSIKKHGLLQPIGITKTKKLVFGERRLMAWKTAHGDKEIKARIINDELAELIENIHREDLPWQIANAAIAKFHYNHGGHPLSQRDNGGRFSNKKWTENDTANSLDISQPLVSESLTLDEAVRDCPEIANELTKDAALNAWQEFGRVKTSEEIEREVARGGGLWARLPVSWGDGSRFLYISEAFQIHDSFAVIEDDGPIQTLKHRTWFFHSINPTRELTLDEYAEIQGFPPTYKFVGSTKDKIKWLIGEAVPPPMAEHVARMLPKHGLKFADIFAGAGGMTTGFERIGNECVWACEREPNAAWTFKLNHPEAKVDARSIEDINEDEIPKVDLIIGGPPCQGFSVAGHNFKDDPRNKLYKEFLRIVKGVGPQFFVIENVPGILRFKDQISADASEIGYSTRWDKIEGDKHGMRQRRVRIFVTGKVDGFVELGDSLYGQALSQAKSPAQSAGSVDDQQGINCADSRQAAGLSKPTNQRAQGGGG